MVESDKKNEAKPIAVHVYLPFDGMMLLQNE